MHEYISSWEYGDDREADAKRTAEQQGFLKLLSILLATSAAVVFSSVDLG